MKLSHTYFRKFGLCSVSLQSYFNVELRTLTPQLIILQFSSFQPSLVKAPMVGAECKENQVQGKWQEAQHAGNWDSGKQTQQKAHVAQSQIPEDIQLM